MVLLKSRTGSDDGCAEDRVREGKEWIYAPEDPLPKFTDHKTDPLLFEQSLFRRVGSWQNFLIRPRSDDDCWGWRRVKTECA